MIQAFASPHSGRRQQIDFNNAAIYEVADPFRIRINLNDILSSSIYRTFYYGEMLDLSVHLFENN